MNDNDDDVDDDGIDDAIRAAWTASSVFGAEAPSIIVVVEDTTPSFVDDPLPLETTLLAASTSWDFSRCM